MSRQLAQRIETLFGSEPLRIRTLTGGCIGEVCRVDLPDNPPIVAKTVAGEGTLDTEAYMLRYLAEHTALPVPTVLYSAPDLLLLTFIEGESFFDQTAQQHAAGLLAELHNIRPASGRFGFERDTLIGPLTQINPPTRSWRDFFRDHRLLYMGDVARRDGSLPARLMHRLENFCAVIDRWIDEPEHPSLIHGDAWTTNMLAQDGRMTGFIDPAIYYAHAEIELAFTTLFGTFSAPFFRRYHELRPIAPGFFEERRDIYNLYPLLVHVRLFGGTYVGAVERTLSRFGF